MCMFITAGPLEQKAVRGEEHEGLEDVCYGYDEPRPLWTGLSTTHQWTPGKSNTVCAKGGEEKRKRAMSSAGGQEEEERHSSIAVDVAVEPQCCRAGCSQADFAQAGVECRAEDAK